MKPKLKKGDDVVIRYGEGANNSGKLLTGIVDRVYKTTFGSKVKDWGVSVIIDSKDYPCGIRYNSHMVNGVMIHDKIRCGRYKSTFRASRVKKI